MPEDEDEGGVTGRLEEQDSEGQPTTCLVVVFARQLAVGFVIRYSWDECRVIYGVTTKELTILFLVQATQENDSNAVFRGDEVVWRFPWGGGPPKNECQSRTTVRKTKTDSIYALSGSSRASGGHDTMVR